MSTEKPSEPTAVETERPVKRARLRPMVSRLRGGARAWNRWGWHVVRRVAGVTALCAVLGLKYETCNTPERDCRSASRDTEAAILVELCQEAYAQTADPEIGILLGKALYRSGDRGRARTLAQELLGTVADADALHLLGRVATLDGRLGEATHFLERARRLHHAEGRISEVAADEQALAGVHTTAGRFADALRSLDSCIVDAQRADTRLIEGYCHLSAASALSRTGFFRGAHRELSRAAPLLEAERDLASLHFEEGNLNQDLGYHEQAVLAFESSLKVAERAQLASMAQGARLNLAWSLAHLGRTDEAEHLLERAESIDRRDELLADRVEIAGLIAYKRGRATLAASLLDEADRITESDDDRLDIAVLQARIALEGGDLPRAESWARRGVERAESMRAKQSALELRPWVLSSRRAPYELLFTALARTGRVEEAFVVFDQWHGRTLLDALSRPVVPRDDVDLRAAAVEAESLRELLPSLSDAPLMRTRDARVVIDALRSGDLLVLLVAEGEVWRLISRRGELEASPLGRFDSLRSRLDGFAAQATDRALAEELGAMLLPADLFRDDSAPLHVILDGVLARLPLAALRRGGRPLIAVRPLVRVARLSATRCASNPERPRHATILADAQGDLPAARREAVKLGRTLGAQTFLGSEAASKALFASRDADLLHLAVHGDVGDAGGALRLSDRRVSALEIAAHRLGPALVVLSACVSAVAGDSEQTTSVATAFLAGGSSQVVATLRPVTDPGAEEVTDRFYGAGGADDPVGALAAVQKSLADSVNADWPNFAVFVHDMCHAKP